MLPVGRSDRVLLLLRSDCPPVRLCRWGGDGRPICELRPATASSVDVIGLKWFCEAAIVSNRPQSAPCDRSRPVVFARFSQSATGCEPSAPLRI